VQINKARLGQKRAHLGFAERAVAPCQPDQSAAPMRAADRQDQKSPRPQKLRHPGQSGLGVGQVFQKMRGGHQVMAAERQRRTLQIPCFKTHAARPQPGLCRPKHGCRAVQYCQREAWAKRTDKGFGESAITGAKVHGVDPARRCQKARSLHCDGTIGGRKAQTLQPPPPSRGGGVIARG
jgi:hypothetical protein